MLLVLALVTATVSPPAPAVGDLITVEFQAPVQLDASEDYEVVSKQDRRVVIRTFTPRPLRLSGTTAGVRFANLTVPVRSVLRKNDDMKPAPLSPPRPLPAPRLPWLAIGAAAALAAATWLWLARLARPALEQALPSISPDELYRRTVLDLRRRPSLSLRWAALADATRRFLAATRPRLSSSLTTTEILPRLDDRERVVAEILRQGDLEKFSAAGAPPRDFDALSAEALDLAHPEPPPEEAPR